MRKAIICLAFAFGLAACTDAQLAKVTGWLDAYNHSISNFDTAVAAIDQSIANTSALHAVAEGCTAAVAAGTNLKPLVSSKSASAANAMDATTAAITTWCDNKPTDIASAVAALTAATAQATAVLNSGG